MEERPEETRELITGGTTAADVYRAMRDPRIFATTFAYTIHRAHATLMPDFEHLRPFWDGFLKREDMLIIKSKQMTASWACAIGFYWDIWTDYHEDWHDMMMSRVEGLVDDGGKNSTPDSLLGKVRYVHEHTPDDIRKKDISFDYLKIRNRASNCSIKGKSSNQESGRGGNFQRGLQDEDPYIPKSEAVYSAVRDGIPRGLIKLGTPNGKGNCFHRQYNSDTSPFRIIRMHWSQHPERKCDCKGEHRGCWYASKKEDYSPLQLAREVDMSFEQSVAGRVYYDFDERFIADVPILEHLPTYRWWDFGVGDQCASICCQINILHTATGKAKKQMRIFDAYRNTGQGARHYREVYAEKAKRWPSGLKPYDIGDPHNLTSRESYELPDGTLTSWQKNLSDDSHPYKIHVHPSRCRGIEYDIVLDNSRKFVSLVECQDGTHQPRLLVDKRLRALIECFEGWRYRADDEGQPVGSKPLHDSMSHWMDAFKYGAWHLDPMDGWAEDINPAAVGIDSSAELFDEKEMARW